MSSEWTLGDICEVLMGQSPPGEKCGPNVQGLPLLNGPTEFGAHHPTPVQYTSEPKRTSEKGDLLFCVRGSTTGRMNYGDRIYAIGRGLAAIRDKAGLPISLAKAVIECGLPNLLAAASGSTFPSVNRQQIEGIPVPCKDIDILKRIGCLSESIEQLIYSLTCQNTTLEAIAQRLFRSWFVTFDPVHAKAAGQEPEAMSAELAALFPSEFEESALGLIPKGWLAGSLQDVSLLNPETWSGRNHPAEVTYLDLSGIKKNSIPEVIKYKYDEAPSRARRVLKKGDSLYGTVRPGNLSYGYIGEDKAGLTGSTGFAVLRPKHTQDSEYVYCAMTLKESIERLVLLADGAAYPAVRPEIVYGKETVLADEKVMAAFHRITKPLFQQITINKSTIKCLCELRDHFLPRLISGQLSLADAEAALAAVKPEVEQA